MSSARLASVVDISVDEPPPAVFVIGVDTVASVYVTAAVPT